MLVSSLASPPSSQGQGMNLHLRESSTNAAFFYEEPPSSLLSSLKDLGEAHLGTRGQSGNGIAPSLLGTYVTRSLTKIQPRSAWVKQMTFSPIFSPS